MRNYPLALMLLATAAPAWAQAHVNIESAVFVEHAESSLGEDRRTVRPADFLRQGDRVITVVRWDAPRGSYTVTSAVPRALRFERSSVERIEASSDGGRTWQLLTGAAGQSAVTHLRWRVEGGAGRLTYSAVVR